MGVAPEAQTAQVRQEAERAFRERLSLIRSEEERRFERALHRSVQQSLAALRFDAARSVQEELEPALRRYIPDAPQTRHIVHDLTRSLSRQVQANAADVVKRLASEEAANGALSCALEERCLRRVDERIGALWSSYILGSLVMTLAGVACGWSWGWSAAAKQRAPRPG